MINMILFKLAINFDFNYFYGRLSHFTFHHIHEVSSTCWHVIHARGVSPLSVQQQRSWVTAAAIETRKIRKNFVPTFRPSPSHYSSSFQELQRSKGYNACSLLGLTFLPLSLMLWRFVRVARISGLFALLGGCSSSSLDLPQPFRTCMSWWIFNVSIPSC